MKDVDDKSVKLQKPVMIRINILPWVNSIFYLKDPTPQKKFPKHHHWVKPLQEENKKKEKKIITEVFILTTIAALRE